MKINELDSSSGQSRPSSRNSSFQVFLPEILALDTPIKLLQQVQDHQEKESLIWTPFILKAVLASDLAEAEVVQIDLHHYLNIHPIHLKGA
jgi:hypothetical protein